jgi:cyclophilin family peptidyl-prolyl cis-trans isomerase
MPPADKRARKKENARAAREEREAAARRKKRTRSTITVGVVVALFVGVIVLLNVAGGDDKKPAASTTTTVPRDTPLDPAKTYTATIASTYGSIKIEMDVKNAPIGAAHFVSLARKGVYNGSRWHRILKDFVVQGGAPGGDAQKEYGHSVVAELPKKYELGDVAAAKAPNDLPGTFDSQFFVVTGSQGVALPGDYAVFAHLTSGSEVLDKLMALKVDGNGDPMGLPSQKQPTITKVTISES